MNNPNEPAQPINIDGNVLYEPVTYTGLTKRERMAMEIAKGIYSGGSVRSLMYELCLGGSISANVADLSLKTADKILGSKI